MSAGQHYGGINDKLQGFHYTCTVASVLARISRFFRNGLVDDTS
jgi:hypothetical protein